MKVLSILVFLILSFTTVWANELTVNYEEIYSQVRSGDAVLIDARTGLNRDSKTFKGALWIRFPESTSEISKVIESLTLCLPRKKIYFFCHVGSWAGFFSNELQKAGFDTENVGAYSNWKSRNFPESFVDNSAVNDLCPFSN